MAIRCRLVELRELHPSYCLVAAIKIKDKINATFSSPFHSICGRLLGVYSWSTAVIVRCMAYDISPNINAIGQKGAVE